jgi:hypothetical protein
MSASMRFRASVTLAALLLGCGGDEKPEPKEKAEEIQLKSIYVTFTQKGPKNVKRGDQGRIGNLFHHFSGKVPSGASNLFLVRGKTIDDAGEATRDVLVEGDTADFPVPRRKAAGQPYWLVVVLGIGGSAPPVWQVESAQKTGKVIRLTVEKPKREKSTKDYHLYMVWVPLGKLDDGVYKLELLDKANDEPSLVRRVVVKDKDR